MLGHDFLSPSTFTKLASDAHITMSSPRQCTTTSFVKDHRQIKIYIISLIHIKKSCWIFYLDFLLQWFCVKSFRQIWELRISFRNDTLTFYLIGIGKNWVKLFGILVNWHHHLSKGISLLKRRCILMLWRQMPWPWDIFVFLSFGSIALQCVALVHLKKKSKTLPSQCTEMRFCKFPFRWIYYCHSSNSTGKETGKTHLCAMGRTTEQPKYLKRPKL